MIKQALSNLSPEQKQELIYALENDITAIVRLDSERFIGVNVVANGSLLILESNGPWSYGSIKQPEGAAT